MPSQRPQGGSWLTVRQSLAYRPPMNKRGLWSCHLVAVAFVCSVGCTDDAVCGDGVTAGRETCDDANVGDGDGCSAACVQEAGWSCVGVDCSGICNDGLLVDDEPCDPSTSTYSYCSEDCSMFLGSCGDGVVQPGYEACDAGSTTIVGCEASCDASFGYTCSGSPGVCDASPVAPNTAGTSLSVSQRSNLCGWYVAALGGAGRQIRCGALIYTVNSVSACANRIGDFLGSCTVAQFEQWVGDRGNECSALESTVPIC